MSVNFDSSNSAIHSHINILQSVISRMAGNSAMCKTWCVTLVAAIIALVADKGLGSYSVLIVFPTTIFMFMDSYYLAMEKMFRKSYEDFIKKVHSKQVAEGDLFIIQPRGDFFISVCASLKSGSIWPFYVLSFILAILIKWII